MSQRDRFQIGDGRLQPFCFSICKYTRAHFKNSSDKKLKHISLFFIKYFRDITVTYSIRQLTRQRLQLVFSPAKKATAFPIGKVLKRNSLQLRHVTDQVRWGHLESTRYTFKKQVFNITFLFFTLIRREIHADWPIHTPGKTNKRNINIYGNES
jgi:hypothetical protein